MVVESILYYRTKSIMILVWFCTEENVLSDEIKTCYIFEYQRNENASVPIFWNTRYSQHVYIFIRARWGFFFSKYWFLKQSTFSFPFSCKLKQLWVDNFRDQSKGASCLFVYVCFVCVCLFNTSTFMMIELLNHRCNLLLVSHSPIIFMSGTVPILLWCDSSSNFESENRFRRNWNQ